HRAEDYFNQEIGFGDQWGAAKGVGQGLLDIPRGIGSMVAHPIQSAADFAKAHQDMWERANQERDQGNAYDSTVHRVASLLPGGPTAVNTGEMIGGPNTPRAGGQIAGALLAASAMEVTKGLIKKGAYAVYPPDIA